MDKGFLVKRLKTRVIEFHAVEQLRLSLMQNIGAEFRPELRLYQNENYDLTLS